MSETHKRNMEEEGAARPARKRARKACVECHNRKIRCDLYLKGAPCTNCEEDGQHCELHIRKGKRTKPQANSNGQMHQPTMGNAGNFPVQSPANHSQAQKDSRAAVMPPGRNIDNQSDPSAISSYNMFGHVPNHFQHSDLQNLQLTDMQGMSTSLPPNAISLMDTDFSQFVDLETMFGPTQPWPSQYGDPWNFTPNDLTLDNLDSPLVHIGTSPSNSSQQSQLIDTMDWTSGDRMFLKSQGCFNIPHSVALHRLMHVYFQNVHPNLPLIHEGDFWRLWPSATESGFQLGSMSVFVLQSMCFAASSFASDEIVQDCGFTNAAAARENFHRRAKLLFDFGFEKNPLHLSQGALLLSYHVRNMDRLRKNSQWLANGVLYAYVAFGDRASLQISDANKRERTLKRLWWCAILRDRIMPLGLRRPVLIRTVDSDFPYLTEADFDDELGESKVHDRNTQRSIFQIVCATCQLADVLTPALLQMFSSEKPQDRVPSSPDDLMSALNEVRKNIERLRSWQESAEERFPSPIGLGDTHNTVTVFGNLMFIYCNAAIMGLCHHGMLLWETRASSTPYEAYLESVVPELERAMDGTTERVRELVQLNLVYKTPLSLAAYLTFPLLMHAITAKGTAGSSLEGAAGRQLEIYARAMRFQQSVYDAADFAHGTVERIMAYAENNRAMGSQHLSQEMAVDSSATSAASGRATKASPVLTWKDLLQAKPRLYLRLAIQLDIAFCTDTDGSCLLVSVLALRSELVLASRYGASAFPAQNSSSLAGVASAVEMGKAMFGDRLLIRNLSVSTVIEQENKVYAWQPFVLSLSLLLSRRRLMPYSYQLMVRYRLDYQQVPYHGF